VHTIPHHDLADVEGDISGRVEGAASDLAPAMTCEFWTGSRDEAVNGPRSCSTWRSALGNGPSSIWVAAVRRANTGGPGLGTVEEFAHDLALPWPEVEAAADRLARYGLAHTGRGSWHIRAGCPPEVTPIGRPGDRSHDEGPTGRVGGRPGLPAVDVSKEEAAS
jgi:hypothetical protein